jgi:GTP cyclohydrolase I
LNGDEDFIMTGAMADVQKQPDHRNLAIDKVGVKDIRYPVTVMDRAQGSQQTVAAVNMYVDLPHHYKGTHMSRFIEVLNRHSQDINLKNLHSLLEDMKSSLEAGRAHIEISFPYFIDKRAPVSQARALMEYMVTYRASLENHLDLVVEIKVPVTTLCPCSKEISSAGAHNQRGIVRLAVRITRFIWIEDMISLVEESASCQIYSLLKRADEKFVTETAYANPRFVEDIVREICLKLEHYPAVTWFSVEAENMESIHNHSAYAFIERHKNGGY